MAKKAIHPQINIPQKLSEKEASKKAVALGYSGMLAEYKKARFNYEILETMEAGIELTGNETKAVRLGNVTFEGSHIGVRGNEVFLIGTQISPYQPSQSKGNKGSGKNVGKSGSKNSAGKGGKNNIEADPTRSRKLLLNKQEIIKLADAESVGRQTIIPLAFFARGRYVKLSVGIVRGKKKADKRQTLKQRDDKRDIDRTLKFQ